MTEFYDIFISYRRNGGFETAKHLNDLLVHDGYTVSFDIDTLREGDFDETLHKRIDQCVNFILVVDKHTFDRTFDSKFVPKKDWLRIELAYAYDDIFKNTIWNNIFYQTDRVTTAFRSGRIDIETFMNTPMQELTKFKGENLHEEVKSNSQIKLKGKNTMWEKAKTLSLACNSYGDAHSKRCPRTWNPSDVQFTHT